MGLMTRVRVMLVSALLQVLLIRMVVRSVMSPPFGLKTYIETEFLTDNSVLFYFLGNCYVFETAKVWINHAEKDI